MRKSRSKKQIKNIQFDVDPNNFLNRDISWLHFNRRVLAEAADKRNPLLERLRFLMIFNSNLDEFAMKRLGRLKVQINSVGHFRSVDGKTPQEQLKLIRSHILEDVEEQHKIMNQIEPELKNHKISFLKYKDLTDEEKADCDEYFRRKVFPVLTPLSVDPGHPFPFISNLSFSLGLILKNPQTQNFLFSRVKIPDIIPSWIPILKKEGEHRFISIVSIIKQNLNLLYPGMEILEMIPFRITRNADVEHRDDDADDLLMVVEEGLKERRLAECVRLEIIKTEDKNMLNFLRESLEINEEDIYEVDPPLDLMAYKKIVELDCPSLKFKPWHPVVPKALVFEPNIFNLIKQKDILLHHPYESFSASVEKFIAQASEDPSVLTIKMTLYRTGDDSPFIKYLIRAAEMGKQVVCLIELKARFDEQRNIFWAHKLEDAGIHVVYGILGLKTHTKTALVIRKEADGDIMAYAHIGTGNYHAQTANFYTDLGLMTSRREITDEVIQVFNYLTGSSLKVDYKHMLVAPINMKTNFLDMIGEEINSVKKGAKGLIIAKMNSLEDETISEALYRASNAGVEIILFVRGFCCLKPQVKGLSENIRVISIIGRFLEHSRIFYFLSGQTKVTDGKFFIGSADWMHRNLHNRVELIVPIEEPSLKNKLWDFIEVLLQDHRQAWVLQSDGQYIKMTPQKPENDIGTHEQMMANNEK